MDAFKAFTALTLVDMISSPLTRIRASITATNTATSSLSSRMGKLAAAMAPVAVAAGVVLGSFLACTGSAIAFESAMADVSKVVAFESVGEMKAMSESVKELAGRLPMAQEGIAAIIAAAGQSGVAKADLVEFAEQAAKMGIAFDLTGDEAGKMMADWRAGMNLALPRVYALADSVNYLSNNMNATAPALGEVIQRVGALAMSCGLSETQVAALGAAFLSAGASPEIASTALKKFTSVLVSGTALSKDAAKAFASIGFSAVQMAKDMQTDAQGTIFKVLQALADKPKELQISLLKEMFGEEAIGAIAPLLANMGNLTRAFELVGDSTKYAGSMQAEFEARSKTTENALQLMRNRLKNLSISIGTLFLPAIGTGASLLGSLADALRWVVDSPFGQWLIRVLGVLSAVVIGVTAFSGAMWAITKITPFVTHALAPLRAALLGLGWPILTVIAAIGLLYLAYQTNFGGIADAVNRWYNNIRLVVRGVIAVFQSLDGTTGTIRGELATEIKAAGLTGLITTISKLVYRLSFVIQGIKEGFVAFGSTIASIFMPPLQKAAALFIWLGGLAGDLGLVVGDLGAKVGPANTRNWLTLGKVLGYVSAALLSTFAVVKGFRLIVMAFTAVLRLWRVALLAVAVASRIWRGAVLAGTLAVKLWHIAVIAARVAGLLLMGLGLAAHFIAERAATLASTVAMKAWDVAVRGAALAGNLIKGAGIAASFVAQKGAMLASVVAAKAFTVAQWLLNASLMGCPLVWIIGAVIALAGAAYLIIKNWDAISEFFGKLWDGIVAGVTAFGSMLLGGLSSIGESISGFFSGLWQGITGGIASFGSSALDSITGIGESITGFFSGINLFESGAKILDTLKEGVLSKVTALKDTVSGAFAKVRDLLPFSDAKEGPLSQLTLSGSKIMSTLAEGVGQGAGSLQKTMSESLGGVGTMIGGLWDSIKNAASSIISPAIPPAAAANAEAPEQGQAQNAESKGNTYYTINIANITLPNVKDAKDFMQGLTDEIESFGGGLEQA